MLFVCGGRENILWCDECAEGLGALRIRWVIIDLQYSLENLGGG